MQTATGTGDRSCAVTGEHGGGSLTASRVSVDSWPPIAEHGLIGDLQTAALVATDGTINWWCTPRFDSPSVFGSLLDPANGGHFRIAPETDDYVVRQMYFPDTAIVITRFMTPDGVGEVIDFMPIEEPHRATDRHRLAAGSARCPGSRCDSSSSARRGSTTGVQTTNWK